MIKIGYAPYLECSSKGDKRFSSFYAKVNGKSIEEQYQAAKVFADGSTNLHWKQAKGKVAVNIKECTKLYKRLWKQYLLENPELLTVLKKSTGLSDTFGQTGCNCQAIVLWELRNEL